MNTNDGLAAVLAALDVPHKLPKAAVMGGAGPSQPVIYIQTSEARPREFTTRHDRYFESKLPSARPLARDGGPLLAVTVARRFR